MHQLLVTAADGVPLNVVAAGPEQHSGPSLLLIHGSNQSHICWRRQLTGQLAEHLKIVAFDLRGHGNSGKPWGRASYKRTSIWADDIQRVIEATGLVRPVMVAWSMGGWIAMHYIRHFGTDGLAGLVLVASRAGLIPMPPPKGGLSSAMGGFTSGYLEDNISAAKPFTDSLVCDPTDPDWQPAALASALCVPPYVRSAMAPPLLTEDGSALTNNEDLLPVLKLPMELVFGAKDSLMDSTAVSSTFAQTLPTARRRVYDDAGHAVFFDAADSFNADLLGFVQALPSINSKEMPA